MIREIKNPAIQAGLVLQRIISLTNSALNMLRPGIALWAKPIHRNYICFRLSHVNFNCDANMVIFLLVPNNFEKYFN